MKNPTLGVYVATVGLAAAGSVALLPREGLAGSGVPLAALAFLAAVVGSRAVRIPGLGVRVTASDLFVFVALAGLAPLAAPLIALAGVAGTAIGRDRDRSLLRFVFNLAAVPLAAAVGAWSVLVLQPTLAPLPLTRATLTVLGALVYISVNLVLVAGALTLEGRRSFLRSLASTAPWTMASTVASALAGLGLVVLLEGSGAASLSVGLVTVPLFTDYYRTHQLQQS